MEWSPTGSTWKMWLIFPGIWVIVTLQRRTRGELDLLYFCLAPAAQRAKVLSFHPPQSTSTIAPAAVGEGAYGKRAQFTQLNTKNLLLASQRELWIAWLFYKREQNMHTVSNSIQATPSWDYLIRTQKLSVTSAYCNYLVAEHTAVITPNTPNSSQNFQLCSLLVLIASISVRKKSKCFYWMLHTLHIKMAQKRIVQVSQYLAFCRCLCSMCIL